MADDKEDQGLLSLTTEIVASFVGNNPVAIGDLPAVIAAEFGTLRSVTQGEAEKPAEAEKELNKAVKIYPQFAAAWTLLGDLHREHKPLSC